jgi:hypothetical protein
MSSLRKKYLLNHLGKVGISVLTISAGLLLRLVSALAMDSVTETASHVIGTEGGKEARSTPALSIATGITCMACAPVVGATMSSGLCIACGILIAKTMG